MPDAVAIDFGGTNIVGLRVAADGEVLARREAPSRVSEGAEAVMARIEAVARGLLGGGTRGVGIASPGLIDPERGICRNECANVPGWKGMRLAGRLAEATGLPAFAESDGNAAALAETWIGAAHGERVVLLLTLGTGIGGGIVSDGRIWRGASNGAGEFGHITIDYRGRRCPCGSIGCFEQHASAAAVGRAARERVASGASSAMLDLAGGDVQKIEAKTVFDAARTGDVVARTLVRETAVALAAGIGSLVNAFNPSAVVLAGGMALAGEALLVPVREELAAGRALPVMLAECKLLASALGSDAVALGAAKVVFDRLEEGRG